MFVSRFWLKNIHLVRIYVKTIHFICFFVAGLWLLFADFILEKINFLYFCYGFTTYKW